MSDNRRIMEIYLDVDQSLEVNENNASMRAKDVLYRQTFILMRAHLRRADGTTYYTPDESAEWEFRIDNSFDSTHDDLVISDNDDFNIGADWDELDVAEGKICWRVDTNTTQLAEALGTKESETQYAELWMTPPGGNPTLLCHWEITMHNIATDVGTSVDLVYSTSDIIARDGDDVVIYFRDGSVARRWIPKE